MSKKRVGLVASSVVAIFVLLGLLGVDDVVDLPSWANIPGIDLPGIGDTDAIDCRLQQVEGTRDVEISIVDGNESTYADYVHVWNNGNLIQTERIDRRAENLLVVPSTDGTDEQYYSISIEPVPDERVYCQSLVLK